MLVGPRQYYQHQQATMQKFDYAALRRAFRKHARTTSNAPQGGSNTGSVIAPAVVDESPPVSYLVVGTPAAVSRIFDTLGEGCIDQAPVKKSRSGRSLMDLPTELRSRIFGLLVPVVVEFVLQRWSCSQKQLLVFSSTIHEALFLVNKMVHREAKHALFRQACFYTECLQSAILFCKLIGDDIQLLRHLSVGGDGTLYTGGYFELAQYLANARALRSFYVRHLSLHKSGSLSEADNIPTSGIWINPVRFFHDLRPLVLARGSERGQKELLTILAAGKCTRCWIRHFVESSQAYWNGRYHTCLCLKHLFKADPAAKIMAEALSICARICTQRIDAGDTLESEDEPPWCTFHQI
ncbi:hypothetical protein BDZ85DRAFT_81638 [Elsinoe ampelina]|uniref:Uncharacterized protein n=1 Tax=Elsinoe ampelina TaxID=302913 RepID=A0A6A6FYX3_9PEZI|nr:hypothetical protein BDZ85DRAFT_81638 [Elsinoe ampelina]